MFMFYVLCLCLGFMFRVYVYGLWFLLFFLFCFVLSLYVCSIYFYYRKALHSFLFYFCSFCSIKLFLISYLPHNLIVQCFTHARLGLRECQVVSAVCEVYCVLCGRELNYYLVSSCFSLVYLHPHFHIL